MMLRSLLDEIIRRHLWPIPVLALLVVVAVPALFLKSAPAGAPAPEMVAPPAAAPGTLPSGAQRKLPASAASQSSHADPFQPPASHRRAGKAKRAAAKSGSAGASSSGSTVDAETAKAKALGLLAENSGGSSKSSGASPSSTPSTPSRGSGAAPVTAAVPAGSVDLRFGKGVDSPISRSTPPLQPFFVHGKLVAVFEKYSPSSDKAVFAVAPATVVKGPVRCRREDGVCRYLDIPAGSYAQLTSATADGTIVLRRLDVVRIDRTPPSAGATATAATERENACLLHKLQTQKVGDPPIDRDACKRSSAPTT